MNKDLTFKERECWRCGKQFIVHNADEWVFRREVRRRDRLFCSWSCVKAFDREKGSKADRRDKIIEALKDGLSVNEVVNMLDADRAKVVYWKNKLEEGKDHERKTSAEGGE